jgi:hypothetical protein
LIPVHEHFAELEGVLCSILTGKQEADTTATVVPFPSSYRATCEVDHSLL